MNIDEKGAYGLVVYGAALSSFLEVIGLVRSGESSRHGHEGDDDEGDLLEELHACLLER